jgi:hypothetical protein
VEAVVSDEQSGERPVAPLDLLGDVVWGGLAVVCCTIAGAVSSCVGWIAGVALARATGLSQWKAPGPVTDDWRVLMPAVFLGGVVGPAVLNSSTLDRQ